MVSDVGQLMSREERLRILDFNREAVIRAWKSFPDRSGLGVIVADTTDPVGRAIVVACSSEKHIAEHAKNVTASGQIPTAILVMPIKDMAGAFASSSPVTSLYLASSSPKTFPVACVAAGGTTLTHFPLV